MRHFFVTVHSYIHVGRERQSMSIVSFRRDNELRSSGEPRSGDFANGASEL